MTDPHKFSLSGVLLVLLLATPSVFSQETRTYFNPTAKPIPAGAKIYVAPIPGGLENYIAAGILKKKLPVVLVAERSQANYEISGVSETEKAGWAKMFFLGTDASNEQASIQVTDLNLGEVVFAYSVSKRSSARGKQSAGEACAKHLKEKIRFE